MKFPTRMEMVELALIVAAVLGVWIGCSGLEWAPQLRWVFGYCAVVILAQGLVRDVVRLMIRRREADAPRRRIVCLCAESSIGLVLLLVGAGGLSLLGVSQRVQLEQVGVTILLGALLMIGFVAKDFVLSIRRERDHASVLVW